METITRLAVGGGYDGIFDVTVEKADGAPEEIDSNAVRDEADEQDEEEKERKSGQTPCQRVDHDKEYRRCDERVRSFPV